MTSNAILWLFLALLSLLLAAGLVFVLWLLHAYRVAAKLVSKRKSGVVHRTSSATDTTKIIKPRKGTGYDDQR